VRSGGLRELLLNGTCNPHHATVLKFHWRKGGIGCAFADYENKGGWNGFSRGVFVVV
jgi:hypothetical protein